MLNNNFRGTDSRFVVEQWLVLPLHSKKVDSPYPGISVWSRFLLGS